MTYHTVRHSLDPLETQIIRLNNGDLNRNRILISMVTVPIFADDAPQKGVILHMTDNNPAHFDLSDNSQIAWAGFWGVDAVTDSLNILTDDAYLTNIDPVNNVNVICVFGEVNNTSSEAILTLIRQRSQA
jgi:hypothetical protein